MQSEQRCPSKSPTWMPERELASADADRATSRLPEAGSTRSTTDTDAVMPGERPGSEVDEELGGAIDVLRAVERDGERPPGSEVRLRHGEPGASAPLCGAD